jgi:hypothetical protein
MDVTRKSGVSVEGASELPRETPKRPRSSSSGDGGGEGSKDASQEPPVDVLDEAMEEQRAADLAAYNQLFVLQCGSYEELVAAIDTYLRRQGFLNLHLDKVRAKSASFKCSCRRKGCFPVSLTLTDALPTPLWSIKTMNLKPKCDPQSAIAVATCSTFIPDMVKLQLLLLFDAGLAVTDAHNAAITKAVELSIPTTWQRSDVKNFFDSLIRRKDEVLLGVLDALSKAGHKVALDWQENAVGARVLNRFLVTTETMMEAFQRWGHLCILDATYGKNSLQMPVQCFVGLTSENVIIPFSVGSTRSETDLDYEWLVKAFLAHHGSLPSTWVTDGDEKIFGSIARVAQAAGVEAHLLLCIWHLFQNIKRHLNAKNIAFVDTDVKKLFYHCRAARSEADFTARWSAFIAVYGTKDVMRMYLEKEIFSSRKKWCLAWVDGAFHGTLMASSPSESFHALLASGHSANRSLAALLKLIDGLSVKQLAEHEQRCTALDKARSERTAGDMPGLAYLAAEPLLSGTGRELFHSKAIDGLLLKVSPTATTDATAIRAWAAVGLIGSSKESHLVEEVDPLIWKPGPSSRLLASQIQAALAISGMRMRRRAC